ncbi:hypothetical protein [Pseudoruegeria sp. SK021]|uniref:hypothetical protein n=1 Tax=Pseudoruegeria sp. SK021 TaxID=1933035 RepID=UPI000A24AE3B|nr:hypothetical protein [Pseudoruegeria sp. SK021]OSP55492.1 hypothetical protein BV911_07575 [Pseudoruegeria sp. SK021]
MTQILATLTPSPVRRVAAIVVLVATAGMMLWVAASRPPESLGWLAFLMGMGSLLLWLGWALWQATERSVSLTDDGLFDSDGRCLCRIDQIAGVDSGAFAFKPSNGFVVRLTRDAGSAYAWAPGLWWQIGRKMGVGGVTPKSGAKQMADILTFRLAERRNAASE